VPGHHLPVKKRSKQDQQSAGDDQAQMGTGRTV
jgi:hypothetical protein